VLLAPIPMHRLDECTISLRRCTFRSLCRSPKFSVNQGHCGDSISELMGYLRLLKSPEKEPGPEEACVAAFDKDLDYVFETLRRLGARAAELEDLAHDVFLVLYRNWPTLDTSRTLRPYIFGVAFRIVCAHNRRRSREVYYPNLEAIDGAGGQEETLASKQSVAILLAALELVPLSRRAVVIMHELDEVPVSVIAETLAITRFGVHARLRKGRMELARAVRQLQIGRRR
jgi:RNA polymerase sigma-70 factor, ECF subfamily